MAKTVQYKGYTVLTKVSWTYDKNTLTVNMYPSRMYPKKVKIQPYKKVWKNTCPGCQKTGVLQAIGAKKGKTTAIEGEIYCTKCKMRFDGVQGYQKKAGSKKHLTAGSTSAPSYTSYVIAGISDKQKKSLNKVKAQYNENKLPKKNMTLKIPPLEGIMDGYCHQLKPPLVGKDVIVYVEKVDITQNGITLQVNDKLEPPGEEYKPPTKTQKKATATAAGPATGLNPYQTKKSTIKSNPIMGNPPAGAGTIKGSCKPNGGCISGITYKVYEYLWVDYCPACKRSKVLYSTCNNAADSGGVRCRHCTADYDAVTGFSMECHDGTGTAASCSGHGGLGCGHRLTAGGSGGTVSAGSSIEKKIMTVGNSLKMNTDLLTVKNIYNYLKVDDGKGGFRYSYYYDWPGGDINKLNTSALQKHWNSKSANCVWFAWCFYVMCKGAGVKGVNIIHNSAGHLFNTYKGKRYDCTKASAKWFAGSNRTITTS